MAYSLGMFKVIQSRIVWICSLKLAWWQRHLKTYFSGWVAFTNDTCLYFGCSSSAMGFPMCFPVLLFISNSRVSWSMWSFSVGYNPMCTFFLWGLEQQHGTLPLSWLPLMVWLYLINCQLGLGTSYVRVWFHSPACGHPVFSFGDYNFLLLFCFCMFI